MANSYHQKVGHERDDASASPEPIMHDGGFYISDVVQVWHFQHV
jgi:hypothetical protein